MLRERVVNKLTSGKFLLTLMAGVSFVFAVVTDKMPNEVTASIITMVFTLYFNKPKEERK